MLRVTGCISSAFLLLGLLSTGCAGPAPAGSSRTLSDRQLHRTEPPAPTRHTATHHAVPAGRRAEVVQAATSMLGVPYRYGGVSRKGVDCSGLVVYSYRKAGLSNLPRTASDLEAHAEPVAIRDLEPGDLLFFTLSGKKTSHVAIFVGNRAFVHAPSKGKGVERVRFDHVFWGPKIRRAGRLL